MEIETELLGDETPNHNQKTFPFPKSGKGSGEGREKLEGFWFWTRVKRAPRGAVLRITTRAERTKKYKATTRSARAKHASYSLRDSK